MLEWFKGLLSSGVKKIYLKTNVSTNVDKTNTSRQVSGTGQTDQIRNKNGQINIDNSVTNNNSVTLKLPENEEACRAAIAGFKQLFRDGKIQFVDDTASKELDDFNNFEKDTEQKGLIKFFSDKIPADDLLLLRTGLYVQKLSQKDPRKSREVRDRAAQRSNRARNIVNLASAGYFESYIRPIFENDGEFARKEYEDVVKYMPEIIFVHGAMNADEVVQQFEAKVAQKEKYHLHVEKIMINGLGQCVGTIKEAVETIKQGGYKVSFETKEIGELIQAKAQIKLPPN